MMHGDVAKDSSNIFRTYVAYLSFPFSDLGALFVHSHPAKDSKDLDAHAIGGFDHIDGV